MFIGALSKRAIGVNLGKIGMLCSKKNAVNRKHLLYNVEKD